MPLTLRRPVAPVAMVETNDELAPNLRHRAIFMDDNLWGEAYSFHFKTGATVLDAYQHKIFEEDCVSMMKTEGACIEMYALADRTGSQKVNYDVTRQRLWYIQFLANNLGAPAEVAFDPVHKYFGEDFAESSKMDDDEASFYHRAVLVWMWPNIQSQVRIFVDEPLLLYGRSHPQP